MTNRSRNLQHRSGRRRRTATNLLALGIAVLCAATAGRAQDDQRYSVLHTFGGKDGANPQAALIRDPDGNLYGTAFSGGDTEKCDGLGCGVVFKLDQSGKETVLYTFEAGDDGAGPASDLLRDEAGNLYGTTHGGGDVNNCLFERIFVGAPWDGCGVVFRLDPGGKETTLYAFTGSDDGGGPSSGLVRDERGNLYGTTVFGGDFRDCSFYGMPGCGVVYKLDVVAGEETALHAFTGGADGLAAYGDLLLDPSGHLFGATDNGGDTTSTFCSQTVLNFTGFAGCGTVFMVDHDGEFVVLHTFHGADGGPYGDGWLIQGFDESLYGVTGNGGNLNDCGGLGCGVVFKRDTSGKETVLYSFTGGADGGVPLASVIADAEGNLYGTTLNGGDVTDPPCVYVGGCGVVFKLDPRGNETVLYTFKGGADGANPGANLLLGDDGNLYGTAQYGGDNNCSLAGTQVPGCGVVFKISLHSADQ